MRMSCTICPCKEYVAEESVKCAFCGHFPILHQIVSPENSSSSTSTSTSASNMQSYFALLSEPLHIPKEKFGSSDSSSWSVNVSDPAPESPKGTDLEERDEENTKHKQKIRKYLAELHSKEDGLPYLL